MVVLNFFCAHTTAHSSALKLLAFLCLLFLSRVIFPFVWYIASVRLYFEIFVSATTYVVWWCGLLLLFCSWFTFLMVIIEKKHQSRNRVSHFFDMMKSTTNGPKFSSPDQFTQSAASTQSLPFSLQIVCEIFAYAQTWTGVQKYTKL